MPSSCNVILTYLFVQLFYVLLSNPLIYQLFKVHYTTLMPTPGLDWKRCSFYWLLQVLQVAFTILRVIAPKSYFVNYFVNNVSCVASFNLEFSHHGSTFKILEILKPSLERDTDFRPEAYTRVQQKGRSFFFLSVFSCNFKFQISFSQNVYGFVIVCICQDTPSENTGLLISVQQSIPR